jgi:hypothetical protein
MGIASPPRCKLDVSRSGWAFMLPANRPVSRRTVLRLVQADDAIEDLVGEPAVSGAQNLDARQRASDPHGRPSASTYRATPRPRLRFRRKGG